jgi:hypothetical protein
MEKNKPLERMSMGIHLSKDEMIMDLSQTNKYTSRKAHISWKDEQLNMYGLERDDNGIVHPWKVYGTMDMYDANLKWTYGER